MRATTLWVAVCKEPTVPNWIAYLDACADEWEAAKAAWRRAIGTDEAGALWREKQRLKQVFREGLEAAPEEVHVFRRDRALFRAAYQQRDEWAEVHYPKGSRIVATPF